jgi:hypothetical protein
VEGTSKAHLCAHISINNKNAIANGSTHYIEWTPMAITQFWSFLLRQRNENNFGPLSLAYIMTTCQSSNRKRSQSSKSTRTFAKIIRSPTKLTQKDDELSPTWEYIKIYHDAQYSLQIRSLLDCFRWDDISISQTTPSNAKKSRDYRVLKGAKLLLLDNMGESLLVS